MSKHHHGQKKNKGNAPRPKQFPSADLPVVEALNSIVKAIDSTKCHYVTTHNNTDSQGDKKSMTSFERWMIGLTGIYVLAAGLQWFAIYGQLDQMEIQTDQSAKALAQSQIAFKSTIEASRLDQRAWVGINHIDLTPMQAGKPLQVQIHIVNSGKTFARDLRYPGLLQGSEISVDDGDALEKNSSAYQNNLIPVASVIFPTNEVIMPIQSEVPLTQENINNINSGNHAYIYLVGEIYYDDVFGQHHKTRYFYVYSPITKSFAEQRTHNDAD